jgi:hypothetical protein
MKVEIKNASVAGVYFRDGRGFCADIEVGGGANIERAQIPISRDAARALGAALFKQVSIVISDEEAPSA